MISYGILSRAGGREYNEDSVQMCEMDGNYVFALADGLGGHAGGADASASVTGQAVEVFKKTGDRKDYLDLAFQCAQGGLMQQKESAGSNKEMKSTMVLLQIRKDSAAWAHIGDSRLYYFEKNEIVSRTMDHSVPQMLANSGQIKESEIRNHVDRNRVLRTMGAVWEDNAYELAEPVSLKGDQAFLLCSDGFWELITEKEMEKTFRQSKSVAQWLRKMEKIVLKNGKDRNMDNYSAIAVYIE